MKRQKPLIMISKTSKSIFIQCDWRSVYNSINWVFAKLSNFFANLKLFFFVSVAFSLYLSPINQGNQFCALKKSYLLLCSIAIWQCTSVFMLCSVYDSLKLNAKLPSLRLLESAIEHCAPSHPSHAYSHFDSLQIL